MRFIYNKLLLNWKGPSQKNYLVGTIQKDTNGYTFQYNKSMLDEARDEGFSVFVGLSDESKIYQSPKLFSIFERRLPNSNRAVFKKFLQENNLSNGEDVEWDFLTLTNGRLATDSLSFCVPAIYENNALFLSFEVAGWSFTKEDNKDLALNSIVGIQIDYGNIQDKYAVELIDPSNQNRRMGYIQRPFNHIFYRLIEGGYNVVGSVYSLNAEEGRPSVVLYVSVPKDLLEKEEELQYLIDYH